MAADSRPSPASDDDQTISLAGRAALRWALADDVGPTRFLAICAHFGGAEPALSATPGMLTDVPGIADRTARAIVASRDAADVDGEISHAASAGVRILCQQDVDYPANLRHIPDPPIVLFVKGALLETDAVSLAIVGSRRCTRYGAEQAQRFGESLAQAGLTVVSGLARGVDAHALQGAVNADGRTIAVMGRGLAEIFPSQNKLLAEQILRTGGAWVSELPMNMGALAKNFPRRNRIIVGLTLGTLVVEAADRSGALITARLTTECNRELFALPGRVDVPMSFGPNRLIRDGAAKLVLHLDDILDELGDIGRCLRGERLAGLADAATDSAARQRMIAELPDVERRVYDVLDDTPQGVAEIAMATKLTTHEILSACTTLELRTLVRRNPGPAYSRR